VELGPLRPVRRGRVKTLHTAYRVTDLADIVAHRPGRLPDPAGAVAGHRDWISADDFAQVDGQSR
jgi:hypothetical protein